MSGVRVDGATDCWIWQRQISTTGYGMFTLDGHYGGAHRAAYTLLRGPIPVGFDLDHLCRNRACVNPDHLEPVTRRENLLRGDTVPARRAAQKHCKRGHEFTPENTYVSKRGERVCRKCHAAKNWGRKHGMTTDEVIALREGGAGHLTVEDVAAKVARL